MLDRHMRQISSGKERGSVEDIVNRGVERGERVSVNDMVLCTQSSSDVITAVI